MSNDDARTVNNPMDPYQKLAREMLRNNKQVTYHQRAEKFSTRQLPWKLIPQLKDLEQSHGRRQVREYRFCAENSSKVSDVESFAWKWSPSGRYGVEAPGGRDSVGLSRGDKMAVFDMHRLSWEFYRIVGLQYEIPRMAFIYWVREDMIVFITLLNEEPDDTDFVYLRFRQSFLFVNHKTGQFEHLMTRRYDTTKYISVTFWYHIFENRRGEPFEDENTDLWLVFSNSTDCLILIPFIPSERANEVKYVEFDMDRIMKRVIGEDVHVDSFVCNHFVPWVYLSEINFFVKIDEMSFDFDRNVEENVSVEEMAMKWAERKPRFGYYQIRIDLRKVMEMAAIQATNGASYTPSIQFSNIRAWRKLNIDVRDHCHFTQYKNRVVVMRWNINSMNKNFGHQVQTTVSEWIGRWLTCPCGPGTRSFYVIDLNDGSFSTFFSTFLPTDVISPHPSGSMLMFRYKEDFGMRMCELPFFEPLSLATKCTQTMYRGILMDPQVQNQMPAYCGLHTPKSPTP